jgi:hypothetical protein
MFFGVTAGGGFKSLFKTSAPTPGTTGLGHKRVSTGVCFGSKADLMVTSANVRKVPITDVSYGGLARPYSQEHHSVLLTPCDGGPSLSEHMRVIELNECESSRRERPYVSLIVAGIAAEAVFGADLDQTTDPHDSSLISSRHHLPELR